MSQFTVIASLLSIILAIPAFGLLTLICVSRVRRDVEHGDQGTNRLLASALGGFMLVAAIAAMSGLAFAVSASTEPGAARVGVMFTMSISLLLLIALAVGVSGVILIRISVSARAGLTPAERAAIENRISLAQLLAACQIALPVMFMGPLFVLIALVLLVAVEAPAMARRTRQGHLLSLLAIAVRNGLPLPGVLNDFADTLSGRHRVRVLGLADRLGEGTSLPDALDNLPGLVPRSVVVAAHVGFETNTLAESLEGAARRQMQLIRDSSRANDISGFLVYAAALLLCVTAQVTWQMTFFVPKLKTIFQGFDADLPELTNDMLVIADSLFSHVLLFGPLISIPCLLILLFGVGWYWGWDNVHLAWLRRWFPRLETPPLLRSLARTVSANRELGVGLAVHASALPPGDLVRRLDRISGALADGQDFWRTLSDERLISSHDADVLKAAETMGHLDWALDELADAADRRRQRRLDYTVEFVRPLIIVVIGLLVGAICLASFLPLVKLINQLS